MFCPVLVLQIYFYCKETLGEFMGILFCRMILRLQVPQTKFHAKQNQDMLRANFVLF